mgnify:CR=1 FL=1
MSQLLVQPSYAQVHPVDTVLTNMSVAWAQDESAHFARKFFPIVPVNDRTGKFLKFKIDGHTIFARRVKASRPRPFMADQASINGLGGGQGHLGGAWRS